MVKEKKGKSVVLILPAALIVLGVVFLAGCRNGPSVQVATVTRGNLKQTITSNGKVEPISPTIARAESAAFVDKVVATEGQAVHRGQLILTLGVKDVESQLAETRADLLAVQQDLLNARAGGPPDEVAQTAGDLESARGQVADLERTEKALETLVTQQAATKNELTQKQAELAAAKTKLKVLEEKQEAMRARAKLSVQSDTLRIEQDNAQIQSLKEKAGSATVVSPVNGTLYSLPVQAGDYVKPGDILAEMADLRRVRVRAYVDEPDLGWLELNQNVEVTWDGRPGSVWPGRTEQLPKQVTALGPRNVGAVLCSIDNAKLELLPNVSVEVRIMVRERPNAVVVSRAAVRYDNGQHFVFVFSDGEVHRRDISVGIASPLQYEVLSGLNEGERVALPGDRKLEDGMEIRAAEVR